MRFRPDSREIIDRIHELSDYSIDTVVLMQLAKVIKYND